MISRTWIYLYFTISPHHTFSLCTYRKISFQMLSRPLISTKAKRCGEISRPHGSESMAAGNLSAQSLHSTHSPWPCSRHETPLEMTMEQAACCHWPKIKTYKKSCEEMIYIFHSSFHTTNVVPLLFNGHRDKWSYHRPADWYLSRDDSLPACTKILRWRSG